jgi:hypothetical protein
VGPLAMWRVEAGAVPVLEMPPSWRRRNGFRPRLALVSFPSGRIWVGRGLTEEKQA